MLTYTHTHSLRACIRIPDYWSVITLTRHIVTTIVSFLCLYPYCHVSVDVSVGIRVGMNVSVRMRARVMLAHHIVTTTLAII